MCTQSFKLRLRLTFLCFILELYQKMTWPINVTSRQIMVMYWTLVRIAPQHIGAKVVYKSLLNSYFCSFNSMFIVLWIYLSYLCLNSYMCVGALCALASITSPLFVDSWRLSARSTFDTTLGKSKGILIWALVEVWHTINRFDQKLLLQICLFERIAYFKITLLLLIQPDSKFNKHTLQSANIIRLSKIVRKRENKMQLQKRFDPLFERGIARELKRGIET